MSRGPGRMQRWIFGAIRRAAEPITFADILARAFPDGSFEADMIKTLGPTKVAAVRSLRRALKSMCDDGALIAIGEGGRPEPHRYFIDPVLIAMMCDEPEAAALFRALKADSAIAGSENKDATNSLEIFPNLGVLGFPNPS